MGTETRQKNSSNQQQQNQQQQSYNGGNGVETITTNATGSQTSEVHFVPVTVDENNVAEGALEILKVIRPNWDFDSIEMKLFTDGITNKLVGCFHIPKDVSISSPATTTAITNNPENGTIQQQIDDDNVVLIRVYGNKTDLLIDRKAETRNIKILHTYGFAPTLFGIFKNGLAYEYIPGCTLTPTSVIKPKIWKLIAKRMAEMHKVESPTLTNREPMLWRKIQQFLDLIPEKFSDPIKHERIEKMFLPVQKLRDEFTFLYKRLENLKSPIVFAHNDLLLGNVIYTETINRVTFIDYEYSDYNFQAYDIGNHFTEFAGIDEVDYTRYPMKDFQMEWLKTYLETYLETDDVNLDDIERLYVQVNQFALASHFFWTIWALIQAHHSSIDFDFVQFAHLRYNEYLAKRDLFLSLECKN